MNYLENVWTGLGIGQGQTETTKKMHNFESVFFLTCLYYFVTVTTNDHTTQKSQSFTMAIITII